MPGTNSSARSSTMQLILVPSLITLAVTILRLVGELQRWPSALFNANAGGVGAIVGIVWLVFVFGIYFAIKLAAAGEGPTGAGKPIGFAVLGLILLAGGIFVIAYPKLVFPGKVVVGLLMIVAAAVLQRSGWPALFKTLLAYAYAARTPVAIIMYFAIKGNWGTHYDAPPPNYTGPSDLWGKFFQIGVIPQLFGWIVFTIVIGSLFGSIAAAIAHRDKSAMQTAS